MRVFLLLPFLFLSACGSRQPVQQTAQTGVQSESAQTGLPISNQAAPPPPAGQAAPESAPTVAQQAPPAVAPPAAPQPAPPVPVEPSGPAVTAQLPPAPVYVRPSPDAIRIPSGTVWRVRLEETLDTRNNRPGDRFSASLVEPIRVDGTVVVPRGAYCFGHLTESNPSGRLKGRALMSLRLDSFDLNGRRYDIRANQVSRQSGKHKKRNLILIGGGSGFGTALGAIAGGPAGALIGAGAGGAAGLAGAAFTGKKNIRLPVETTLVFYQRFPLSI